MVRDASTDAIELARRAQAIAGPLGLTEVLSDALNSEACAVRATSRHWAGPLHRALEAALAGQHEAQVARAYVNLHACYVADRDWANGRACPALPASARRRLGRRGPPLDGPGLPPRGRDGLARVA